MKLIVNEMPTSCQSCLFSRKGANVEDKEYKCFCSLLKTERIMFEWETIQGCPLIEYKTVKSIKR